MKVLVLGGDGFLGSHLTERLVELGHEVTVFDRFPYGRTRNLAQVEERVRILSGDLAGREMVAAALQGQEVVFHFACATNPFVSWNDIPLEIEQNLLPTVQMLQLAAQAGVKKVVFPSSGGTVYGPQERPVDERCLPRPVNPYGIFKLTVEHLLAHFREKNGLAFEVFRISNAFGPRQPVTTGQGVIGVWMRQILEGQTLQVYGDERTVRDYVYVGDVVELVIHALDDLERSDVYNLGTGRGTSIIELLEIFKRVIDRPFRYQIHPRRPSDALSNVLDNRKLLARVPGFRFSDLEEKIRETWLDYRRRYEG